MGTQGIRKNGLAAWHRRTFAWTLFFFAVSQAAVGEWIQHYDSESCNPLMAVPLHRLQQRLAEAPGSPLVLLLGSSRVSDGIRPAALTDWVPEGMPRPVVFNFGMPGSGPVFQLLTLRRLLAQGVRPSWVVMEAFPPFWPQRGFFCEETSLDKTEFYWSDLPPLAAFYPHWRWPLFAKLCQESIAPGLWYRSHLLCRCARFLVPQQRLDERRFQEGMRKFWDESGWLPVYLPNDAESRRRRLEDGRQTTAPILEQFHTDAVTDAAFQQLLLLCREHGLRSAVLLMPEHSALRHCYTTAGGQELHRYLIQMSLRYAVPVIDSRDWLQDDRFADFYHLNPSGADEFTARWGRAVLRPLVAGTALPTGVLLGPVGSAEGVASARRSCPAVTLAAGAGD